MAAPPPHRLNDSRSSSWITTTPNRNPAGSSEQFSSALLAPDQAELARASSDQPRQRNTCKQLIRHKQLRSQIVIIPILFFFVDIVFYGILFGLKSLKGNIYVNGLMVGCADLCAGISLAFLSNIIGRKGLIRVTWAVCGISCLVYNEIKDNQVAEYITVLLGKYGDEGDKLLYRFNSDEDQLRGAEVLQEALGEQYVVALNQAHATPT